jgi:hypothetical protein
MAFGSAFAEVHCLRSIMIWLYRRAFIDAARVILLIRAADRGG